MISSASSSGSGRLLAVAAAYGWRANISDGEALQDLVVLNGGIPASYL